jgi:myosin heavy subunit
MLHQHLQQDQYYWIYDSEDSYYPARLLSAEVEGGDQLRFEHYTTGQIEWIKKTSVYGMIPAPGQVTLKTLYDDLVDAVDISEASILWNLHQRYSTQLIYSSIGSILIALNPYRVIEGLYSEERMHSIMNSGLGRKSKPHIWVIADNAFRQLKSNHQRQAIVISGESGAGMIDDYA